MNMNKILLVLIITSGFLLIIYANNDIFNHKNLFSAVSVFQRPPGKGRTATTLSAGTMELNENGNNIQHNYNEQPHYLQQHLQHQHQQHQHQQQKQQAHFNYSAIQFKDAIVSSNLISGSNSNNNNNNNINNNNIGGDIRKIKYIPKLNDTEYNIFIIYTKENHILKNKLELFLKSLFKYTTIQLHLHIVTDMKSEQSLELIIKTQINRYRKVVFYTLYDVNDSANKINDIVRSMMPLFSYAGSYYNDALFLLSLGLHRIVDVNMKRAILIDCDVVFRTDVKELFDQFHKFSHDNLFALAPELTPVYRHILYKYRANNPHTNFGNPYYYSINGNNNNNNNNINKHKHIKHGYPGLNSGIVMMDFDKIRKSKLYEESLKLKNVKHLVNKYSFRGHLGDQDFYTLLGYEYPGLIYRLDCIWNRQLCTWWKEHGYSDIFDIYFHCENKIKIYHGNCNTRIPE